MSQPFTLEHLLGMLTWPVISHRSSFEILFGHHILSILQRQVLMNTCILLVVSFVVFHVSACFWAIHQDTFYITIKDLKFCCSWESFWLPDLAKHAKDYPGLANSGFYILHRSN
jgi:hypothetical protein